MLKAYSEVKGLPLAEPQRRQRNLRVKGFIRLYENLSRSMVKT